ncbi:MAG TPA: PBP1A family penicillin-binding protein [Chthoniobacterales bacterium]|nr:PBP1A family penicillin-binding protein [Chthoniobacterales bacterium]
MKLFARTTARRKSSRPNKKRRHTWRWVLAFFVVALPIALVIAVLSFYAIWAQTYDLKRVGTMPERNTVFDVDGKIYSRLAGANRLKVPLKEVSPLFIKALLAREDTRFYEHGGIDWRGVARALYRDIASGSAKEGASSITQQLARNSLPLGGRTLSRKLLEAMVALRLERELSKDQILELYLNRIYFGSGCYGVETASRSYFGKTAAKLDLSESALLAGLIRSPNRFSPLKNPKGAAVQRDTVLDRMKELKEVTPAQAERAKHEPINSHPRRLTLIQENYAMDAVQRDLNLLLTPDQIDNGGLFIYTTLDPVVQKAAADAIERQLAKIERQPGFKHPLKSQYRPPAEGEDNAMPYLEGALVAIDNASGGIRALVGGRDYAQSKFNRALTPANRQIGSSFKPFVYTLAFTHGLLPGAAVSDGPIQPGEIQGAGNWSPGNSDGRYGGIKPVSYGLIQSRNTMSVRVGEFAGLDDTQKIATTLGLGSDIPHGAAIYIGSFETDLKDLTSAYTVFPNAGIRKQSYVIERIDDSEHKPIYRAAHLTLPVLDPGATWMTTELMEEVITHGTASSARSLGFKLPAAGKTGTTDDFKDAWFVGFTSSMTCGVWVGFDQPTTIIPRGYGSALALPVWTQTMMKASERYPAEPLRAPVAMQEATVCSISNAIATSGCVAAGTAYEIDLPIDKIPRGICKVHGGNPTLLGRRMEQMQEKVKDVPRSIIQSFKRFFGGGK